MSASSSSAAEPRGARSLAVLLIALALAVPAAISMASAAAPPVTPGQVQFTDGGASGDAANFTNLWTSNLTIGDRAWIGNDTTVAIYRTTVGGLPYLATGAHKANGKIVATDTIIGDVLGTGYGAWGAKLTSDTEYRLVAYGGGNLVWGPGGSTAGDVNLYRSAANTLKTDDSLAVAGDIYSAGVIYMGPSSDASLYRSAANHLKTDGHFNVGTDLHLKSDSSPTITWGSADDTNLYRSAANALKTDDAFSAALGVRLTTATKVTGESPYAASATDQVILYNAVNGNSVVNLPTAVGIAGKTYTVKKIDATAFTVTIDPNASELIDGAATKVLSAQNNAITAVSDGSAWYIISSV